MKPRTLGTVGLLALLTLGLLATAESESEFVGEGAILAFHKQWRHPITPEAPERGEFGTRADLWIVRIDRWIGERLEGKYFLVEYLLYERAVTPAEVQLPALRFRFRKPKAIDGKACNGMTRVNWDHPFKYRAMRMKDFQRTEPGRADTIPPLKNLPCLIMEKPPTAVQPQQNRSGKESADTEAEGSNLHLQIPVVARTKWGS